MSKSLDDLSSKAAPSGAGEAGANSPYVDYDTIFVDSSDAQKIFGNWRGSASLACSDKAVNSFQDRSKLKNYQFDSACSGSKNGVWLFSF